MAEKYKLSDLKSLDSINREEENRQVGRDNVFALKLFGGIILIVVIMTLVFRGAMAELSSFFH